MSDPWDDGIQEHHQRHLAGVLAAHNLPGARVTCWCAPMQIEGVLEGGAHYYIRCRHRRRMVGVGWTLELAVEASMTVGTQTGGGLGYVEYLPDDREEYDMDLAELIVWASPLVYALAGKL